MKKYNKPKISKIILSAKQQVLSPCKEDYTPGDLSCEQSNYTNRDDYGSS